MIIGEEQEIHGKNIVSRYYWTDLDGIAPSFEDAIKTIGTAYTLVEGAFYTIISDMRRTDRMLIQVFVPIKEDSAPDLPDDYRFQSYFQLLHLIATRVHGRAQADFKDALSALIEHCVEQALTATTPAFFRTTVIDGQAYTDIYFGVIPDDYGEGMMVPLHSVEEGMCQLFLGSTLIK